MTNYWCLFHFVNHPILLKINIGSNVGHMVHIRTCKWEILSLILNCLHCFFFLEGSVTQRIHQFKNGNAHYELEKCLIIINFKGIEVLVECNEMGYYIDVLVHTSLSHSETLEIIHENILKTIYQYCASNDGCQGV
ncbi:hypothetical protein CY35_14G095000 [Sphagnum magellanicum]|nr:hypothetical protein CY35_14G095000 [Sphagnum magellanicum]